MSGIRVLGFNRFTRRERFVLAASLSFGIADLLVPDIFTHLFDGVNNPNSGLQGLFSSITIILSTPCEQNLMYLVIVADNMIVIVLIAGIVGVILNLILPKDSEDTTLSDLEGDDLEKQRPGEASADNSSGSK